MHTHLAYVISRFNFLLRQLKVLNVTKNFVPFISKVNTLECPSRK